MPQDGSSSGAAGAEASAVQRQLMSLATSQLRSAAAGTKLVGGASSVFAVSDPTPLRSESAALSLPPVAFGQDFTVACFVRPSTSAGTATAHFADDLSDNAAALRFNEDRTAVSHGTGAGMAVVGVAASQGIARWEFTVTEDAACLAIGAVVRLPVAQGEVAMPFAPSEKDSILLRCSDGALTCKVGRRHVGSCSRPSCCCRRCVVADDGVACVVCHSFAQIPGISAPASFKPFPAGEKLTIVADLFSGTLAFTAQNGNSKVRDTAVPRGDPCGCSRSSSCCRCVVLGTVVVTVVVTFVVSVVDVVAAAGDEPARWCHRVRLRRVHSRRRRVCATVRVLARGRHPARGRCRWPAVQPWAPRHPHDGAAGHAVHAHGGAVRIVVTLSVLLCVALCVGVTTDERAWLVSHVMPCSINDDATLSFSTIGRVPPKGGDAPLLTLTTPAPLRTDGWTHVAVTRNHGVIALHVDGEEVTSEPVPLTFAKPGLLPRTVESPHPYPNSSDTFEEVCRAEVCWRRRRRARGRRVACVLQVSFPGASSINIVFDSSCASECHVLFTSQRILWVSVSSRHSCTIHARRERLRLLAVPEEPR
jgi:hypothetical protein